jgi:hypothetical protein
LTFAEDALHSSLPEHVLTTNQQKFAWLSRALPLQGAISIRYSLCMHHVLIASPRRIDFEHQ